MMSRTSKLTMQITLEMRSISLPSGRLSAGPEVVWQKQGRQVLVKLKNIFSNNHWPLCIINPHFYVVFLRN